MKQTVNQRIKALREAMALSQTEFAYESGLSLSLLAKLEIGSMEPSRKAIDLITKAFNVSEEWMLHGKGEMTYNRNKEVAEPVENSPWRDEAFKALKSENSLIRTELERAWALVRHFSGGQINFRKASSRNRSYVVRIAGSVND